MKDFKTEATELFEKISPEMQDEIIALMKIMAEGNASIGAKCEILNALTALGYTNLSELDVFIQQCSDNDSHYMVYFDSGAEEFGMWYSVRKTFVD